MKQDSKIAAIISLCLVAFGVLIFMIILPFLFMWSSLMSQDTAESLNLSEKAVKTSVFKFQKIYTMNDALSTLALTGNDDKVIEYFEELEKLEATDKLNTLIAILSYIKVGDLDKALMYAQKINSKNSIAHIYLLKKDYAKASSLVDELLKENSDSIKANLYKSQLLYAEGKWKEADIYIDKVLTRSPSYIEALEEKAKICAKLGKNADAKKYESKAEFLKARRKNLYK